MISFAGQTQQMKNNRAQHDDERQKEKLGKKLKAQQKKSLPIKTSKKHTESER